VSLLTAALILPLMVLISIGLVGIGISIGSLMNNVEGFQLIFNFLVMPMFFLSGALFPIKDLPVVLKLASYIDPLTYSVELLRRIIVGVSSIPISITLPFVLGFSAVMMFVSSWLFSRRS